MNWPYEVGASHSALQGGFEAVVHQFQRPLAQYLHRFVYQRDAAIDLTQETFVKAFQNLHRYDNSRPFSTWIFSIASNLAKDRLRKTSRAAEVPYSEYDAPDEEPHFRRPDRQLEASELGQALEAAIAALPLLYREPLLLRHTAGLSVEQTAEVLGTSAGVVKTRLFRARARLQEALGKEWLVQ
jgi:RNA polymerase sigma-70 factor (ECF subfamily)